MLNDTKAITTSQKNPQNFVSPQLLAKFMQQRSFREFRLENERKRKKKKTNIQAACLICKQGITGYNKAVFICYYY